MSKFSGAAVIPVFVVGAALVIGPAIYDSFDRNRTYCTDANNVVVPDDRCDNTSPTYGYGRGYYVHRGRYPSNVRVGSTLPPTKGATKADASSSSSRSKAGISSSGRVTNGKSGGFGSTKGSSVSTGKSGGS